jgi:homeobox-leucine zipper protein
MELGLSLGETMADAGRDLVLGLGMGMDAVRREDEVGERRSKRDREEAPVRRELELGEGRCGRASPEPPPRLTLLSLVPSLGLPWSVPDTGE